MGKNVAVFVDVANIFYAAKAAGVDIDYVTLLKAVVAGRDFVRAYAYTGLDPENENQRNFHAFLGRNGYKVVSKDIRKYGDGKVKANLDIELVVDMMKTARNLDVAIVVSGDGDFAPAIRAVQEMGVRVEVVSFRGNTSSDLIEVADQFTDITNIAKVDKGSTRSGRRVTADEEDLSMTEVPDKQTEGTARGRGRGRGRGAGREERPAAAERGDRRTGAASARAAAASARAGAATTASGLPLTVLPGEKLSKVAAASGGPGEAPAGEETLEAEEALEAEGALEAEEALGEARAEGEATDEGEARRRRRRRGGRGRGRGRGRTDEGEGLAPRIDELEELPVAPRGPRPTPFGSVWDSQLGMPRTPAPSLEPVTADEEDFEEPEIPEYLLSEQRRRGQGGRGGPGGRGGRGGRAAYAAAIERERYGRGSGGGGINRYPDVSGRGGRPQGAGRPEPRREERPTGGGQRHERGRGDEPWSEVPPELEELLRAQLAARPKAAPKPATEREPSGGAQPPTEGPAASAATTDVAPAGTAGTGRGRGRRRAAPSEAVTGKEGSAGAEPAAGPEPAADAGPAAAPEATAPERATTAPRRRTTRRTSTVSADAVATPAEATGTAGGDAPVGTSTVSAGAAAPAPRRRTTRRAPAGTAAAGGTPGEAEAGVGSAEPAGEAAPKRRTSRRTAASSAEPAVTGDAASGAGIAGPAEEAAPKRRATRRPKPDAGEDGVS